MILDLQEKCHQYWPSERSARYQYFVVDPMAEYNMPQYILREFKVTDARVSTDILREFRVTDGRVSHVFWITWFPPANQHSSHSLRTSVDKLILSSSEHFWHISSP